jgi:hypothetical protein
MKIPAAIACLLAGAIVTGSTLADAAPTASSSSSSNKAVCIAAFDKAQASRAGRKLLESRGSYLACSEEKCPEMIRDECVKGLREVDEALPTLVLSATVDGKDATDASAIVDGEHLTGGLDGRAISVDPGPHTARFERPGSAPIELKVVAREGEKNRLVTGTFILPHAQKGQTTLSGAEGQRFPVVPVALAGAGVLALGGAFFVHMAMTDRANSLGKECAPACPQSDRNALSDQLVLRNVTLGVGLGALAVAAVTYVVGLRR